MREFAEALCVYTGAIFCLLFWLSLFFLGLVELITTITDKETEK